MNRSDTFTTNSRQYNNNFIANFSKVFTPLIKNCFANFFIQLCAFVCFFYLFSADMLQAKCINLFLLEGKKSATFENLSKRIAIAEKKHRPIGLADIKRAFLMGQGL